MRGAALFAAVLLFALPAAVRAQLDTVVASINGRLITQRDMEYRIFEARTGDPELRRVPDELLVMRLLPEVIDRQLLYNHFWTPGSDPDEAMTTAAAEEQWQRLESLASSPLQFRQTLADAGIGEQEFRVWLRREAERGIVVDGAIAARIDPALLNLSPPTAAEAVRVLLRQIVVSAGPASGRTDEDAYERALRIRLHLAEGLAFERAASLFSDDEATRKVNGAVGWIEPENFSAEIRAALEGLAYGDISQPAKVGDSWVILQVADMETEAALEIATSVRALRSGILRRLHEEEDIEIAESLRIPPGPEARD